MSHPCKVTLFDKETQTAYTRTLMIDLHELSESCLKLFNRETGTETLISHGTWEKLELGNLEEAKQKASLHYKVTIDGDEPMAATKVSIHDKTGSLTIILSSLTTSGSTQIQENHYILLLAKGKFDFVKIVKR